MIGVETETGPLGVQFQLRALFALVDGNVCAPILLLANVCETDLFVHQLFLLVLLGLLDKLMDFACLLLSLMNLVVEHLEDHVVPGFLLHLVSEPFRLILELLDRGELIRLEVSL